jgi:uncharacterized protein (DUF2147 family)
MEPFMKKTFYLAVAVVLSMASSIARAGEGMTFNVDGQKIRIEAPRNCNSLSCVSVTKNGSPVDMKDMNIKGRKSDDDVATSSPPAAPLAPTVPAVQAAPAPAPDASTAPPAAANTERVTGLPSTSTARATDSVTDQLDRLKKLDDVAAPAQAPVTNAAPAQQVAAAAATTPLGLWQTDKGNVRVEQCGPNLCGYGEKNGEKTKELVLVNMKPASDNSKWTGRIHDPSSGKDYDSTITMEGPNQLKVQGCALGGLFCGGTTWKRIN